MTFKCNIKEELLKICDLRGNKHQSTVLYVVYKSENLVEKLSCRYFDFFHRNISF